MMRFTNKRRKKTIAADYLTVEELKLARKSVIKMQQNLDFHDEIWQLKNGKVLGRKKL